MASALLKGGVPKRVPVFISVQVLARMMRGKGAVPDNLVHAYIDVNSSPGEQELLHAAYNDQSAVLILDGLVGVLPNPITLSTTAALASQHLPPHSPSGRSP